MITNAGYKQTICDVTMGRDGTRVIDLRFSGRNLTAPPQGYTARSEANVKRWIAALPAPANAPPDDTLTILVGAAMEDLSTAACVMASTCNQLLVHLCRMSQM